MPQDKICILQMMQKHCMNVKSGNANGMMYTAPILLITGSLGSGKSKLIKIITEFTELMDFDIPVRTAFMVIA